MAIFIASCSLVVAVYQTIIKRDTLRAETLQKFADIKSRVDVLWMLLFKRGVVDAIAAGLLERESPLKLNVEALQNHKELISRIELFYEERGKFLPDLELLSALEKQFGSDLQVLSNENPELKPEAGLAAMMFLLRPESPMFQAHNETSG